MTPEEIAERFPEAVATARELRSAFPDVRLLFALNESGELGRLVGYTEAEAARIKARASAATLATGPASPASAARPSQG